MGAGWPWASWSWRRPGWWRVAGRGVFLSRLVRGRGAGGAAPATAAVTRQDLSATTPVTATLGYAGSYPVTGQGGGTLTWLPSAGAGDQPGAGAVPDRQRQPGGAAVRQRAGLAGTGRWRDRRRTCPSSTTTWWTSDTPTAPMSSRLAGITTRGRRRTAVQRLETRLGVASPPGKLSLGQVVFEPEALRVSQVTGQPGRPGVRAGAGGDVGPARGDDPPGRLQESEVTAGDTVTVDAAGRVEHAGRGLLGGHGGRPGPGSSTRRSRCR